ncbi:recombinase family protein [Pedobacter hiemivivus]|uniref:Recombinase family protein n=1 Tax=Pedobacter hiemivivus TaxID=2530454 RepID=A0A4U1GNU0_9SPHI|nr:recombinase family protein [Pedobacter hiemivivus]TKC65169.1 recombinase family protein [Pedobacter hiemivivus]
MQTAMLYIRVSTDEQAQKGYSQQSQRERLEKFCFVNKIQILQIVYEDHSAKTFNRPEWSKLFLGLNRSRVNRPDFILFSRWDRFSRNAADAYSMIERLKKMNIETKAIDQPLNLAIPENKIMLAIYLATSEVENDRRSLNVRQGMRKAKQEGRYMCHAPIGYINITLIDGKKCIIPKEPEATFIKNIFIELAKGYYSTRFIYNEAIENGFKCSLNNFWLMIRNPIYCGKIIVPAYEQENRYLVNGLHEKLISEDVFKQVQQVLNNNAKPQCRTKTNNQLPLRGLLTCPLCLKILTGSASKGKNRYYHYYHCINGCKFRVRADSMDELVLKELIQLIPGEFYLSLFRAVSQRVYNKHFGEASNTQSQIFRSIERTFERLNKAKELLLSGEIDNDDYFAIKADCEYKINRIGTSLNNAAFMISKAEKIIAEAMQKFSNISLTYQQFETTYKRKIIDILTDKRIFCDDKNFHILFTDAAKFIFNLDCENLDEIQAISDSNSVEEFVYSKECEEIIRFESNNNRNIESRNAQNVIFFLERFAELVIHS